MKFAAVLMALAAFVASSAQPASAYTALYAFGDSLSDAGNLYALFKIPGPPYYNGHFSNGPTWVEDLSQQLGLGTLTPAITGGTDFALGGATTAELVGEVGLFETYKAAASLPPATVNGALFTLDIGANDILNALSDASTTDDTIKADALVAANNVAELYADGARTLLYYEVPNLGLTPQVMAMGGNAVPDASHWAQVFNTALIGDLTSLETGSDPLKVFVLDTYDLLGEVVGNPQRFGFSNVTQACIEDSFCLGEPTAEQDKHLFWDELHPTEGGHELAANLAYALVAPEPSTWAMMLISFAGFAAAGWRARRVTAGA